MHVFEPSSKDGNFIRKIPIRLSSPIRRLQNYHQKVNNSNDSLDGVEFGRITNSPKMKPATANCYKKSRFVKRLQNRIEMSNGRPLVTSNYSPKSNYKRVVTTKDKTTLNETTTSALSSCSETSVYI
jgi:hypothetical protein